MSKESLKEYVLNIKNINKDNNYYSRINAIGIYKLVSELKYCKDFKEAEINKEINIISDLLDYQESRVEKDINLYKSNIEKMKQAIEIINLNLSSKQIK